MIRGLRELLLRCHVSCFRSVRSAPTEPHPTLRRIQAPAPRDDQRDGTAARTADPHRLEDPCHITYISCLITANCSL